MVGCGLFLFFVFGGGVGGGGELATLGQPVILVKLCGLLGFHPRPIRSGSLGGRSQLMIRDLGRTQVRKKSQTHYLVSRNLL